MRAFPKRSGHGAAGDRGTGEGLAAKDGTCLCGCCGVGGQEEGRFGEARTGRQKRFIPRDRKPGHFPQKAEQIFRVGRRELRAAGEVAVIVETVGQDGHDQRQGQCDGRQTPRMSSQSLHGSIFPVRREMKSRSAAAVNGRIDRRGPSAPVRGTQAGAGGPVSSKPSVRRSRKLSSRPGWIRGPDRRPPRVRPRA